ncbi:Translation initiation factor 3 subunit J component [Saxophila tyrrhenica]|uniref:Eukaryotic translation initiation factor 3 subunit J n=1 Tax=Saxophila tyrrhenica TaxID=1690608 RepID=A0AAV9PMY6_9PEZI|nr:Translation initiation factor 3 subunit J component [Saxophila tyrrhenica]
MAPSKAPTSWDDEDSDSTPPSSPPAVAARRGKFDDEEDDDVLESWDAAEDSEEEREKAKKAAEAKAKADAAAKASHKSKSQRIEEKRQENMRRRREMEDESSDEEEDEATKRARLRESEKASDLKNAEDLFGGVGGVPNTRAAGKPVTVQDSDDPTSTVDLSKLKIFNPSTLGQFTQLREALVPLLTANSKKPQYASFMKEFSKQLVKDLNSDQVKQISSALSTISNEKMKEEKAAEKGGKKTKAVKTKTSLSANRDVSAKADVTNYDDGLDDDDFM